MRFLRAHSKQAKSWIMLTVYCGLFSSICFIIQAYCLANIVDKVYIHHDSLRDVIAWLFIFVVCLGLRAILGYYKEQASFKSANIVKRSLRKRCFEHILQEGPLVTQYYKAGELGTIFVDQIESTHEFYANYLPQMMLVVLIPIAILIVVFPLNWVAGTLLLITAPLIPLFMALVGWGAKAANDRNFKALARLSNQFLNLIQGMAIIKICGQIQNKKNELEQSSTLFRKRTMDVLRIAFLSSAVLEFFSALSIAMLATYLGLSFLGHLNIGYYGHQPSLKIAMFILLLAPEFYLPLRQLGTFYHAKQQALIVSENVQKLLQTKLQLISDKKQNVTEISHLYFQHVTVRYAENDYNSLDDINLTIKIGESIAILGQSGAGKSTLINLILGFIKPSSGTIFADNQDLLDCDLAVWQEKISWLGQNPQLLFGTLASNLRLANPTASDKQLLEVCRLAQLEDLILSQPLGLALSLGEKNTGLSGGQAQRLALARMYLKPSTFFILDEPTANLDEKNTQLLHASLQEMMRSKTTIISTHKKETAQLAQRIILLHDGKIIADGSFNEVTQHPLLKHWQGES